MDNYELREKFDDLYHNKIVPRLDNYENSRLEFKKRHDTYVVIGVMSVIFSVIAFTILYNCSQNAQFEDFFSSETNVIIAFLVCISPIIPLLISFYKTEKISADYRKKLKRSILSIVLSVFENSKIEENEIISLDEILSTGFFYKAHYKEDDDILKIKVNGAWVGIVETRLTHVVSSGKHRRRVVDFDGIIFKMKNNKHIYGLTTGKQIRQLNPSNKILALFNGVFDNDVEINLFSKRKKLPQITTGSSVLDRIYKICSDNKSEVSSLITPSFEENILYTLRVFNTASVNFAFKDDYFYLFLDGIELKVQKAGKNGFFEIGSLGKTLLNEKIYEKLFAELSALYAVLDKFTAEEKE